MSREPKVIYTAANAPEAYLLKGLLEEQGITARVVNDAIQLAGGELPIGWTAAPQVVVKSEDALRARKIAEQYDRGETASFAEPAFADEKNVAAPEWPTCPQCGEARSARCPACGVTGTQFPIADVQRTSGAERTFLVCESCDDHFLPEWYRRCPRCGHDYGAGVEVEPKMDAVAPSGLRVWVLTAALAAATIFALAYFGWLFS